MAASGGATLGKKDVRALSIEIAAAAEQVEGEEERRIITTRARIEFPAPPA